MADAFDPTTGGGLVSRIAALIAQQGTISAQDLMAIAAANAKAQQVNAQITAQAQQQNGQIWGNSLKSLGQLPGNLYSQYLKLTAPHLASTPYSPSTWQVPLPGAGATIQPDLTSVYDPTASPWASTLIG